MEELLVYGIDLTILVTNITYKLMKIVKSVGPIISLIDEKKGKEANDALAMVAQSIKLINTINAAMKDQIVEGPKAEKEELQETPTQDPSLKLE